MEFKALFADFIAGTPIKRKVWRGYWVYKYGKIEIHSKNGSVIDFLETEDVLFTISGILQDDWEYANDDNCDIEVPNGKKPVIEIPKDFWKTQPVPNKISTFDPDYVLLPKITCENVVVNNKPIEYKNSLSSKVAEELNKYVTGDHRGLI